MRDIRSIHDFIAEDSPDAAARVVISLVSVIQRLAAFPQSGRIVPDDEGREIREVVRRPYRIPYRLHGDDVRILRVFHSARLVHSGELEESE